MDTRQKIIDAALASGLFAANSNGTPRVAVRGWFDVLRSSHCQLVAEAKAKGGKLVALVHADSDDHPSLLNQSSRAQLVAALAAVDYVVICDGTQAARLAEAWKLDAIVDLDETSRHDLVQEVVRRHRSP